MYDRIIVPIEEGAGVESLDQARCLACTLSCTLSLLHVHLAREAPSELEALPQYRYQGVVEAWDERDQEAEEHEQEWLRNLAETLSAEDDRLQVTSEVVHAPISRSLRRPGESVLVVAHAGETVRDGLSPTVLEIVQGGGVPVLVVREGLGLPEIRRILVTLDGSSFSEEVLDPAIELARATEAKVSLLEVVTRHSGLVRLLRPAERSAESAERSLRKIRERIPEELGAVDVRVVEAGNAAAGIAGEARREDIDLVAMATHGRGGMRRLILGSVAESVIRSTQVPVLLYRPLGALERPRSTRLEAAAES